MQVSLISRSFGYFVIVAAMCLGICSSCGKSESLKHGKDREIDGQRRASEKHGLGVVIEKDEIICLCKGVVFNSADDSLRLKDPTFVPFSNFSHLSGQTIVVGSRENMELLQDLYHSHRLVGDAFGSVLFPARSFGIIESIDEGQRGNKHREVMVLYVIFEIPPDDRFDSSAFAEHDRQE